MWHHHYLCAAVVLNFLQHVSNVAERWKSVEVKLKYLWHAHAGQACMKQNMPSEHSVWKQRGHWLASAATELKHSLTQHYLGSILHLNGPSLTPHLRRYSPSQGCGLQTKKSSYAPFPDTAGHVIAGVWVTDAIWLIHGTAVVLSTKIWTCLPTCCVSKLCNANRAALSSG